MSTLREEFTDADYRRAYAESLANTIIATQLRLLRGEMTQQEFADLVGIKQSRVSAMEDENYSSWSTKSLKKVARGKDVVYLGRFVSFGELLDWSRNMSEASLRPVSFAEDPVFQAATGDSRFSASEPTTHNVFIFPAAKRVTHTQIKTLQTDDVRGYAMVKNG